MLMALMLWLPVGVKAQVLSPFHRQWEFGAFGGMSSIGGNTNITAYARTIGLKFAFASELGFRVTENLGQHWGTTLEYSFSNQPMTVTNLADAVPSFQIGQAVHRFAYDILYYPRSRSYRIRPYVFAGPGVTLFYIYKNTKTAAAALGIWPSDPWKANANWGGGAKFLVIDHVAINAQFSGTISSVPRYGLPKTSLFNEGENVPLSSPHGLMLNGRFGIGFVYQWDTP